MLTEKVIRFGPVKFAILVLIVARVLAAVVFATFEADASIWDGVWWAGVTQATVGYGDLSPETLVGRLAGEFVWWSGLMGVAVLTGAFGAVMTQAKLKTHTDTPELDDDIELIKQDLDRLAQRLSDPEVVEVLRRTHR